MKKYFLLMTLLMLNLTHNNLFSDATNDLINAAYRNDLNGIKQALKAGGNVNTKNTDRNTPVLMDSNAILLIGNYGDLNSLKEIIENAQPKPNRQDLINNLIQFSSRNKLAEVQYLIEQEHIDVNSKDSWGNDALTSAGSYPQHRMENPLPLIRYLIENAHANLNLGNSQNVLTFIMGDVNRYSTSYFFDLIKYFMENPNIDLSPLSVKNNIINKANQMKNYLPKNIYDYIVSKLK